MNKCIYCGSDRGKTAFEITDIFRDTYHWCVCQSCKVQFLSPTPTDIQLARAYDDSYYGEGEKKFIPIVEVVVDYFRKKNASKLSRLFGGRGKVLDIGCGNGNLLHYLGSAGDFDLHGIEPEGSSVDRASKHSEISLIKGAFKKETYPPNSFDAVTLIHVFEHLPDPYEAIEAISSIIKPGGKLVIEIPNINSWQAKVFKSNWLHLDPPRHLHLFPPKVLIGELKKRGFNLKKEKYFSIQYNPFGAQQSLLNLILNDRELLYEHLKGNKEYTKRYSNLSLLLQELFHWFTFPIFLLTDLWASFFKKSATAKLIFSKSTLKC